MKTTRFLLVSMLLILSMVSRAQDITLFPETETEEVNNTNGYGYITIKIDHNVNQAPNFVNSLIVMGYPYIEGIVDSSYNYLTGGITYDSHSGGFYHYHMVYRPSYGDNAYHMMLVIRRLCQIYHFQVQFEFQYVNYY